MAALLTRVSLAPSRAAYSPRPSVHHRRVAASVGTSLRRMCQSIKPTASAENNSTAGLEVKRKYELEWQRLQILEVLAKEGRRFVTGEAGKQLLKDMVPGPSQMIKK